METKKRILALREKFGEDKWLSSHAGSFVQDIMGLHSASQPAESPISGIQNLIDINTGASLHDSLIYKIDNEQSLEESFKPQDCTKQIVNELDSPQNEETLFDKLIEIPMDIPTYDPKEGKSYEEHIKQYYQSYNKKLDFRI